MVFSQARHRAPPLRLGKERFPSGSTQIDSSHARHGGSPQARQRGPPLGLGRVGLLSGWAERTASRARKTGPPPRFVTELLSNSKQRASGRSQQRGPRPRRPPLRLCTGVSSGVQQRGPPFGLGKEGLLSVSLQARHRGLLSDEEKRTSSQVQHRGSSQA